MQVVHCLRLVLSTPFGVLSYLLLWFGPPGPAGVSVPWFLVTTCLFETLMSVNQSHFFSSLKNIDGMILSFYRFASRCVTVETESLTPLTSSQCYHVPYLSLNMFLGGDHRDRDSATAYSKRSDLHAPAGPRCFSSTPLSAPPPAPPPVPLPQG